ncbi:hypothetical protein RND81_11G114400 [Saponaria officinalis]|uniref:TCP domain-containing protein n=1 Tax=Saponaria officinalis TaxID=3572 RepID=A0AAW1HLU3_SAPOF
MGLKNTGGGGEIVPVQGGHIIRATGRKDRHSKVFTAKGPRDRRVRLAAHTAIQFYDVQDRLGYDRPSKAVDWLINKAKASIDKLAELPPWDPMASHHQLHQKDVDVNVNDNDNNNNDNNLGGSNRISLGCGGGENVLGSSQFYVPHCVDSHSLGDSMKSFFPTNNNSGENTQNNNNSNSNNNSSINFQNYPHELISRGTGQNHQDLCLSLHTSLHDPGVGGSAQQAHPGHDHGLFHAGFDGGWAQQQDIGRFTRLMGWAGDGGGGEGNRGGLLYNNPPPLLSTQALLLSQQGPTQANNYDHSNQRGTLQSNYSPFARGFEDNQHHINNHNHQSMSSIGHGSDSFMGFYIPSQIHGDLHGSTSMSNRASSSSLSPDSTPN